MRHRPRMILPLLALVFALGACRESSEGDGGAPRLRVGISIPAAKTGWTAGLGYWVDEAKKHHPDVDFIDLRATRPEEQIAQIESMMTRKIDGLVLLAIESAPLTTIARKVKERGIYLYSVDRGLTEPIADVFLEGDNREYGRKSARFMAERLGGQGKIVVLTGVPCTVDTYRVEGAMEVFRTHPGIQILAQQPSDWHEEKSLKVMQAFLAQYPEIDAVWAQDDATAKGAALAIQESGRDIWILGGAGRKDIVKEVLDRNPMFPADITYSPAMIAAGVHLCVANLKDGNEQAVFDLIPAHLGMRKDDLRTTRPADGAAQRYVKLDVHLITPENAKDYYFPASAY